MAAQKEPPGIIRARVGDQVVSIKICWSQAKIDAHSALYPDGIVDVDGDLGKSTPAERAWFRGEVRFQLGLSKERPAPMLPWIK